MILIQLKLHLRFIDLVDKVLDWISLKKLQVFRTIYVHHIQHIPMSVVTFSYWGNYSRLIVTLPSPPYLASQTDLLGFINSGVTPPSSPVEPRYGLEPQT